MASYFPSTKMNSSFMQNDSQFGGNSTTPSLATTMSGGYNPGFQVGKTFKNIGNETLGYNSWMNPDYLKGWAASNPEMFAGMDLEKALTPNMLEGESQQVQQGWNMSPELKNLLGAYDFSVKGASGLEDGRSLTAINRDTGELGYAGTPYSYNPAKDTMQSLTEAAALAAAMFGGVGLAGGGPLAGMFGAGGGATAGSMGGLDAVAAAEAASGGLSAAGGGASALGGLDAVAAAEAGAGFGTLPGSVGGSFSALAPETLSTGITSSAAPIPGYTSGAKLAGSGFSGLVDKLLTPAGLKAGGSILGSLGQIYAGNRAQDAYKDLAKSMSMNFAPGSAYEQTLRKQLERKDAAAGRRSQYGPREVELQAQLAKLQSGQAGTLMDLVGKQNGALGSQLQGGMFGLYELYKLLGGG